MSGDRDRSADPTAGEPESEGDGNADEARYPIVPADRLAAGGWSLRETRVEVRARVAGFVVRAHERRYEDTSLRAAVREAGGPDHTWRLFYATRLTFSPPLPPVVGPATALPAVRSAAREEFVDQLRAEELTDVRRGDDGTLEHPSGTRVTLTEYDATLPVETGASVPMDATIAVWHDGAVLLAGGIQPAEDFRETLSLSEPDYDPGDGWDELLGLIRAVEP